MVADEAMGRLLFERFAGVARRFLDAELHYLGSVPRDARVREAALEKRPVVSAYPDSRAGIAFTALARALDAHVARNPVTGGNAFFRSGDLHARAA